MTIGNFSEPLRRIVVKSEHEARRLGHNYIGTEHLLLALVSQPDGATAQLLDTFGITPEKIKEMQAGVREIVGVGPLLEPDSSALETIGIDLDEVRRRTEAVFGPGALEGTVAAHVPGRTAPGRRRWSGWRRRACTVAGEVRFTPRARRVLELSLREALSLGGRQVQPEHLLLALLREREGVGARLLRHAGLDYESARRRILGERGNTA